MKVHQAETVASLAVHRRRNSHLSRTLEGQLEGDEIGERQGREDGVASVLARPVCLFDSVAHRWGVEQGESTASRDIDDIAMLAGPRIGLDPRRHVSTVRNDRHRIGYPARFLEQNGKPRIRLAYSSGASSWDRKGVQQDEKFTTRTRVRRRRPLGSDGGFGAVDDGR